MVHFERALRVRLKTTTTTTRVKSLDKPQQLLSTQILVRPLSCHLIVEVDVLNAEDNNIEDRMKAVASSVS